MTSQSIWIKEESTNRYETLRKDIDVDVAIVGGGISGVTAAKVLSEQNMKVALIEGHQIGASNTGRSTGNLYAILDIPLRDLKSKYDLETIKVVIELRRQALEYIEDNIRKHNINCDFKRVPWTKFSANAEMDEVIKEDFEIAIDLNLTPEWLNYDSETLAPLKGRQGFRIQNQAQFNPFLYVQGLAQTIPQSQCLIFENTRVERIQHEDDFFILTTPEGKVRARHLIEATHTPLGFSPLQTVLGPYREYGVAGPCIKDLPQDGIYWGYYEKDKVTSIRHYERDGVKSTLIIGEPHKVGQADSLEKIGKLILRGRELKLIEQVDYQWGGQHFRPADLLPYIGETIQKNRYVATGFSTDGLIYGTLAARVLEQLIVQGHHPAESIFNAKRITLKKSAKKFIQENVNVAKQYIIDYLHREKNQQLNPGEGLVIDYQGKKCAVSKSDNGEISVCSAICTHLGCVVHWNNAENSWDCPCHGSRFQSSGEVIEGPALHALSNLELAKDLEVAEQPVQSPPLNLKEDLEL